MAAVSAPPQPILYDNSFDNEVVPALKRRLVEEQRFIQHRLSIPQAIPSPPPSSTPWHKPSGFALSAAQIPTMAPAPSSSNSNTQQRGGGIVASSVGLGLGSSSGRNDERSYLTSGQDLNNQQSHIQWSSTGASAVAVPVSQYPARARTKSTPTAFRGETSNVRPPVIPALPSSSQYSGQVQQMASQAYINASKRGTDNFNSNQSHAVGGIPTPDSSRSGSPPSPHLGSSSTPRGSSPPSKIPTPRNRSGSIPSSAVFASSSPHETGGRKLTYQATPPHSGEDDADDDWREEEIIRNDRLIRDEVAPFRIEHTATSPTMSPIMSPIQPRSQNISSGRSARQEMLEIAEKGYSSAGMGVTTTRAQTGALASANLNSNGVRSKPVQSLSYTEQRKRVMSTGSRLNTPPNRRTETVPSLPSSAAARSPQQGRKQSGSSPSAPKKSPQQQPRRPTAPATNMTTVASQASRSFSVPAALHDLDNYLPDSVPSTPSGTTHFSPDAVPPKSEPPPKGANWDDVVLPAVAKQMKAANKGRPEVGEEWAPKTNGRRLISNWGDEDEVPRKNAEVVHPTVPGMFGYDESKMKTANYYAKPEEEIALPQEPPRKSVDRRRSVRPSSHQSNVINNNGSNSTVPNTPSSDVRHNQMEMVQLNSSKHVSRNLPLDNEQADAPFSEYLRDQRPVEMDEAIFHQEQQQPLPGQSSEDIKGGKKSKKSKKDKKTASGDEVKAGCCIVM